MNVKTIIKFLFTHKGNEFMLPTGGAWGDYRFDFSVGCRKYDWLIVFDEPPKEERLACPPENTILIMTEPASVKIYADNFINQFGFVICPQEKFINSHPNIKYSSAIWNWKHGFLKKNGERMDYEEMLNLAVPAKDKWMSIVCSNKTQTKFHQRRFDFVKRLHSAFPAIDFYGAGTRPIMDKADALLPYSHHVAVENYICNDYWTEKLAEPLLAYTLPFYCGSPNISDYIPADSYVPVDIDDIEGTIDIIRRYIDNDEYQRRLAGIKEARNLLMTKYHPCNQVVELIESSEHPIANNGGIIRTVNHCNRRSGKLNHWVYLWKKKHYKLKKLF